MMSFRLLKDCFISDTTNLVITELETKSKAYSLTQVSNFADNLDAIKDDLARMRTITNELRLNASQLSDGLRGVKRELLQTLTRCGTPACKEVLNNFEIGKLDVNGIDYNQVKLIFSHS